MGDGVAFFGDRRVDRAHRFLHDRLVRHGPRGISVRRLGGSRSGEVRIGRFLRNGKVTAEKIVERAAAGTASRVAGLDVLAIQDTTSFRDDGLGNSLVGHATIAVEAEQGALLGLLDARIIERHGGGGKGAKGRALCDKESQRWLDGLQASGRLVQAGAVRVTAVCDREGDIYEMFAGRPEREHTIDLPARPGQKKRKARIAVRFGAVTLRRPKNRPAAPGVAAQQPVFLVEAREIDPPPKLTPAHWRLLTSHRVESFEQARWITPLCRRRWVIEQLFRTVKTRGFDIERVSMETAPFRTLCAMTLEAGISCLQMVQDRDPRLREGRLGAGRPLRDVFEDEDRPALEAVSATLEGNTEKQKNPHTKGSLAFAAWVCARLGGWTGYYEKPGPVVMLHGLYQFRAIQRGYQLKHDVCIQ